MILRSLTIENFRQVAGRYEIEFAPPGSRNVTVILGENGAGKTNLLKAFGWCLYGKLDAENADELVSHKAIQDTAIGERVAVGVELRIDHGPEVYVIRRRGEFEKLDGSKLDAVGKVTLDVYKGVGGDLKRDEHPGRTVEQLLPEALRTFFFFRGEEIEDFGLQSRAIELRRGVENFLGLGLMGRCVKHLRSRLARGLDSDIRSSAQGETRELADRVENARVDRDAAVERQQQAIRNRDGVNKQIEALERELQQHEEVRPLLEEKAATERAIEGVRADLARTEKDLASQFSTNGFLGVGIKVLEATKRLSADARERGELPARIKPQFVEDLLERGSCICGRDLGSEERAKLTGWKAATGLAALEEQLMTLTGGLSQLAKRGGEFTTKFEELRSIRFELVQQLYSAERKRTDLEDKVGRQRFGKEDLDNKNARLTELRSEEKRYIKETGYAERDVEELGESLAALEEDLKKKNKLDRRMQALQSQRDIVVEAAEGLDRLREGWVAIIQQYLDRRLQENWEDVAQLPRSVSFTEEFELSIRERGPHGDWVRSAPSSANLRALALCFVSGLIQLAKDIGEDNAERRSRNERATMFEGGEFPLVMDAPFATMDEHFKRHVPAGLRRVVPQIVLITSWDQWSGDVSDTLGDSVDKAYVLELHNQGDPSKVRSITWAPGTEVPYVVPERDAVTDWSELVEIKP
ncbi:AAA family ATPase [Alienimonas californiensis]|uniref:Chromosome segregation protein n=1 Tax=Alienimonas californiensis TaxID=2527989 RepID=A0A517PBM5_9PLAN|nr:AAA family ATPase [Alienimonas californiensis]QDT16784.1 chromosome segregation protein [Alienimonas californiensis]